MGYPKWLKNLRKDILFINHNFENINYGACGLFSYYLSVVLDNNCIRNRIVYSQEKNTPKGAYRCDVKFDHIMVDTEYCLIDNNGFYPKNNELLVLDKDKLFTMISEPRLWSNKFDWNRKNELINMILNIKIKN